MSCNEKHIEVAHTTLEDQIEERFAAIEKRINEIELANDVLRKIIREQEKYAGPEKSQEELYKKGLRFGR